MPFSVALRRSLLVCAIALTSATLGGYFSSWRYFEILCDYRPYYLFSSLGVLILALGLAQLEPFRRESVWTLALASLAIMVNTLEVAPWLKSSNATLGRAPGPSAFRAVSFNVEEANPGIGDTIKFLRSQDADVIVLLESAGKWPAGLNELNAIYPTHLRIEELTMDIFSKHPVIQTQLHGFGMRRGFLAAKLQLPRGNAWVLASHAPPRHWFGAEGFQARTRLIEEGIPSAVAELKGPVIVLGDLNASMWSRAYKRMIHQSHLRDARFGFGLVCTQHGHGFPTSWLWRPIDHCLYTADCVAVRTTTGPDLGSDHVPLIVDLQFWPGSEPNR